MCLVSLCNNNTHTNWVLSDTLRYNCTLGISMFEAYCSICLTTVCTCYFPIKALHRCFQSLANQSCRSMLLGHISLNWSDNLVQMQHNKGEQYVNHVGLQSLPANTVPIGALIRQHKWKFHVDYRYGGDNFFTFHNMYFYFTRELYFQCSISTSQYSELQHVFMLIFQFLRKKKAKQ